MSFDTTFWLGMTSSPSGPTPSASMTRFVRRQRFQTVTVSGPLLTIVGIVAVTAITCSFLVGTVIAERATFGETTCPAVAGNPNPAASPTDTATPAPPPSPALTRFEFAQKQMGMRFDFLVYAPTEEVATRAANAAFDRIRELNAIMSDYEPESELMQLCRTAGSGQVVPVSHDLWTILHISQQLSASTNGAFDVTVGPCVRLWRTARRSKVFPADDRLAAARQLVGYRNLTLHEDQKSVSLQIPGMQLDLGGIAVGYALDAAREVFIQHGLPCFLLDGSGDVLAGDPPPDATGWKIGLTPVDNPDGEATRFISLKNAAVTTSGDAWQHVELNGQRYSHIVDPRTGLGLTTRATVTVVANTATTADAFATAVSVLGAVDGMKLIETTPAAAAMIVENRDGTIVVSETRRLSDYLLPTPSTKSASELPQIDKPVTPKP